MVKVLICYSDGQYSLRLLSDKEAAEWEKVGGGNKVKEIAEAVWRAYCAFVMTTLGGGTIGFQTILFAGLTLVWLLAGRLLTSLRLISGK